MKTLLLKFLQTESKTWNPKLEACKRKISNWKGEVKQESIEFRNDTYEKMKKDITEEKQKLETDYKSNEVVQNLIQQNTNMKEQTAELEDKHQRNNLRIMDINEKSGVESETRRKAKQKWKFFCKKNWI